MTKEQLITEIMTSMDVVLGANEKAILNSVYVSLDDSFTEDIFKKYVAIV